MQTLILLGTGTNVGKTYVTAALAAALRPHAAPRPIAALKPIESGVPVAPGASPSALPLPGTDAALLRDVSTAPLPTPNPLHALPDPVSPHLAARRVGRTLDLPAAVAWAAALPSDAVRLIETPGGVFTPLTQTETNFDLACAFGPSLWILVAPDSLGVLHDLGATLRALRAAGRPPDHVVLTAARPADPSTGTNAKELRRLGIADPIVVRHGDPAPLAPLAAHLLRSAPHTP